MRSWFVFLFCDASPFKRRGQVARGRNSNPQARDPTSYKSSHLTKRGVQEGDLAVTPTHDSHRLKLTVIFNSDKGSKPLGV